MKILKIKSKRYQMYQFIVTLGKLQPEIKRMTAKKKAEVVMNIFQGKTTVAEVSRQYDLTPAVIEEWMEQFPTYGYRRLALLLEMNKKAVQRILQSIKEECIWHYNFTSFKEASNSITQWIHFYNRERKHSALKYKTPVEVFRLVA